MRYNLESSSESGQAVWRSLNETIAAHSVDIKHTWRVKRINEAGLVAAACRGDLSGEARRA